MLANKLGLGPRPPFFFQNRKFCQSIRSLIRQEPAVQKFSKLGLILEELFVLLFLVCSGFLHLLGFLVLLCRFCLPVFACQPLRNRVRQPQ